MTIFRKKVYQAVKKIPEGEVLTYREIAEKVGSPRAWRAVGNILNGNENPEVPCHRVIKSNGQIGGYRKGTKRKASLLRKEGVIIRNSKVLYLRRDKTE